MNPEDETPVRRSELQRGRIEALASGFVALLAMGISAYTVYVQRQQLKLQAWPHLVIESQHTGSLETGIDWSMSLKNRGIGPAEVRSMQVAVAGEPASDWVDYIQRLGTNQGVKAHGKFTKVDAPTSTVIAAGGEFPLLGTDSTELLALLEADEATVFSVCYCSMLDDCWLYEVRSPDTETTTPVNRCPTFARKFRAIPDGANKESARRLREIAKHPAGNPDQTGDAGADSAPPAK